MSIGHTKYESSNATALLSCYDGLQGGKEKSTSRQAWLNEFQDFLADGKDEFVFEFNRLRNERMVTQAQRQLYRQVMEEDVPDHTGESHEDAHCCTSPSAPISPRFRAIPADADADVDVDVS
jgi:hypothetical protein